VRCKTDFKCKYIPRIGATVLYMEPSQVSDNPPENCIGKRVGGGGAPKGIHLSQNPLKGTQLPQNPLKGTQLPLNPLKETQLTQNPLTGNF
jgi:hypothetical protein